MNETVKSNIQRAKSIAKKTRALALTKSMAKNSKLFSSILTSIIRNMQVLKNRYE